MKTKSLIFVLMLFSGWVCAQNESNGNNTFVNGFAKTISGTDFSYHSSIPLAKECLLIRATDGKSVMEWETAPVPEQINSDYITVVWLAGLGSSPGRARFDLEINDRKTFEFWADGLNQWQKTNDDGTVLTFQKDMIDQYGDRFGFMFLKIPTKNIEKGKPLRLKVTGGKFNKTSWYMTFKFEIKNGLTFKSFPAVVNRNGEEKQRGVAGILYFGEPTTANIYLDNKLLKTENVKFGYNYIKVEIPKVEKEKTAAYKLTIGDFTESGTLVLKPVKKWRVNFVQHAHTDIGYTRSQTEILAEHLRFIDYALDYCDNTDTFPEDSKFRWTCEATWPINEYLKSRPAAQIERLKKRVAEGRIELTGMYFNFDELPNEPILAASLQALKNIRENNMPVKVAMQNDVNGIGWGLIDYFNDLGIRYLNMGTHGHRALIAFDKPTLFWWESPSGKRMLAYRAEHYMTGNTVFKIHSGDFNRFENELLTYLVNLEKKGYKYDLISIQHSGFLTDNSPPSILASEMIKKWNEKYTWPKLKTATATSFFEEMEQKYGDEFEVIRGAWPDWWTDGFGASAREVAAIRTAQTDLIANTAGLTMAALQGAKLPKGIQNSIDETNNALLFYTEHTVGYHGSVREPFSQNTMEQRAIKESYAWEASRRAKMIGEETMGLLQSFVHREKNPSLLVFNTLTHQRNGWFKIYVDHQIIPRYKSFKIVDENKNEAPAQALEHYSDGTYYAIWVNDIPAFGYKKYQIIVDEDIETNDEAIENSGISVIENQWYKIQIDSKRGAISGLFDKELEKELVDKNAKWELGEFIYEQLDNRAQMEAFKLDNYKRRGLDAVEFEGVEHGNIWDAVKFTGNTIAATENGKYSFEIRLFKTTKRIELVYFIEKKMVTKPEGIYIAFPFQMENGQLAFDVQGGEMRAGIDQIPGSANDWNTVQNYARLSNSDGQILVSSNEIPLFQFGGINTGRYKAGAKPETTHIFGWPMNNYWTTNFNAEQHGGMSWSFTISGSKNNSQEFATIFGWENRVPFLARIIPGGGTGDNNWSKSIISEWPENIILIQTQPTEKGNAALLMLRETGGLATKLNFKNNIVNRPLQLFNANVLGEKINSEPVEIKPFETKFIKIEF